LSMRTSGNVLALRCENSAEPGASFLATSKENPREHGLGLPAMREIARRHRGELFAEAADGRAVVRIGLALDA
ncbi:MAG: GHKL domain-containing protein, partial [Gordonibacter urolithinfaciens]